jgi:hypothetical protein
MIEDDLCLSPILGRSDLERREVGLEEECRGSACSDSDELEAIDEELDIVGDMLGRSTEE